MKEIQISSGTAISLASNKVLLGAVVNAAVSAGVEASLSGDTKATVASKTKAVVTAPDVRVGGEDATLRVLLETFLPVFLQHTHVGVKTGDGVSGPVSDSVPDSVLSQVSKVK